MYGSAYFEQILAQDGTWLQALCEYSTCLILEASMCIFSMKWWVRVHMHLACDPQRLCGVRSVQLILLVVWPVLQI